jgi:hypothetical protein
MTKDEAVELCVKAMLRRKGYPEDKWQDYPTLRLQAENIVDALEALDLLVLRST